MTEALTCVVTGSGLTSSLQIEAQDCTPFVEQAEATSSQRSYRCLPQSEGAKAVQVSAGGAVQARASAQVQPFPERGTSAVSCTPAFATSRLTCTARGDFARASSLQGESCGASSTQPFAGGIDLSCTPSQAGVLALVLTADGASYAIKVTAREEPGVVAISANGYISMAVKADGSLWVWGDQYQAFPYMNLDKPRQIGQGFSAVAVGQYYYAALKPDGSLWAWGPARTNATVPVQISPPGMVFTRIAIDSHLLAIQEGGTLWAMGLNDFGQLGDGTTQERTSLVQIGSGFAEVSAGRQHSFGVKTDGALWAWGTNAYGQFGDGTTLPSAVPKQVGTGYVSTVTAMFSPAYGVAADGNLYGWGASSWGALGLPDGAHPNPVLLTTGVREVATSASHTLAVKTDGGLWTWGFNNAGQVGDGTLNNTAVAVNVGTGFTKVAAGAFHSIALKTDGSVWTWGGNDRYQLGDGTTTPRAVPTQVWLR
ncbi:hypothetical protein [Pseudorhodoferax sp. Leaf267]|uniref:RCC1 domain-containing protein n=1 Tax=Pseudorhodoferax sp. Leaf267 TaxID=1736316 RepID=UPI00138F1DCB|nr:hypothetical protein [Pseudorhodoferax sp. Leaf267]